MLTHIRHSVPLSFKKQRQQQNNDSRVQSFDMIHHLGEFKCKINTLLSTVSAGRCGSLQLMLTADDRESSFQA